MKPAGAAAAAAASVADAKAQRGVQPVPLPGGLPEHCARANPEDKSTPLIPGYYTEKRKWGATLDHGPGCAENDTQAASSSSTAPATTQGDEGLEETKAAIRASQAWKDLQKLLLEKRGQGDHAK